MHVLNGIVYWISTKIVVYSVSTRDACFEWDSLLDVNQNCGVQRVDTRTMYYMEYVDGFQRIVGMPRVDTRIEVSNHFHGIPSLGAKGGLQKRYIGMPFVNGQINSHAAIARKLLQ